jgi:hypothetical protein
MLVIPATWEVEIRRTGVKDPISIDKLSVVVYICHPSYEGGVGRRIRI